MARLALAHAALAVCSLASSGWEELSNPSLYAHLVAAVDDSVRWQYIDLPFVLDSYLGLVSSLRFGEWIVL